MSKEYRSIEGTILGLNRSLDAHFKWLVKVMEFVVNNEVILPEITDCNAYDHCLFGKWLNEKLDESRDDKHFLIELHDKHTAVHKACRTLISSLKNEKSQQVKFSEFETALLALNESLMKYNTYLLQLRTSYDVLTELPLRRVLDESFDSVVEKSSANGLYLMLLDIDHFKKVNDIYGHLTGDEVLQSLASNLDNCTRKSEPVYRYGGEEFIVLLNAENDSEASLIAERIRLLIANTEINAGGSLIHVTFTAGLTQVHEHEPLRVVLDRADKALYIGKQTGRNRCMFVNRELDIYNASR